MSWVSTHSNSTQWSISPFIHMGWWTAGNNRWSSELYYDGEYYIVLSKIGTWTNNYRPTKSRITFINEVGNPVNDITFHVLDSKWKKIGSSDFNPPYNSGDSLDLAFYDGSDKDINYVIVGKGYRNYLVRIEFCEMVHGNTNLSAAIVGV